MIKDSGNRREFETGAVRDIAEGKGRCDLLPLYDIGRVMEDIIPSAFGYFMENGSEHTIINIIKSFSRDEFSDIETAMLEVSIHFEEGCKKYGERNWEAGIPCHCYVDSAMRHYLKYKRGDKDERHDRAFLWNLLCLLWTIREHPELNDLPYANKEKVNDEHDS